MWSTLDAMGACPERVGDIMISRAAPLIHHWPISGTIK